MHINYLFTTKHLTVSIAGVENMVFNWSSFSDIFRLFNSNLISVRYSQIMSSRIHTFVKDKVRWEIGYWIYRRLLDKSSRKSSKLLIMWHFKVEVILKVYIASI